MYKGFNLTVSEDSFTGYYGRGNSIHTANKKVIESTLENFLDGDGSLIASKITENWFPNIDCDVFISHSHKDSTLAVKFAGWLNEEFGLTAFIDSSVWGYSEDLLKIIDKKYCWQEHSKTYSYDKRNKTTSHVNIMLSTALTKMIDSCECVFFLNTPNAISCEGYVSETATESPWIYSEIAITQIIRKELRRATFVKKALEERGVFDEAFKVKYDLFLDHLSEIDGNVLAKWYNENNVKDITSLDILYDLVRGN